MAIPSEKYTLTKYNNTDVYFTDNFPVLYPNANDKFDKSIFYTSPENNDYTFSNSFGSKTPVEIESTFEIPNASSSPTKYNQYKINNETFNNPKLYFCVSNSTATGTVYYQTGMSEDDKTPRKSNANVAFAGNFNTKDIRFMPTISARKINADGTLGSSVTVSLNTLYENPDDYVILTFSSFRYYMRTDTGSVTLGAEPVITINDDNIVGYTSLKNFIEEKTWSMQFGGAHSETGNVGLLYKMVDKKPYTMYNAPTVQIPDWDYNNHISESTVPPELLEYTTIAENDTWIVQGRWSVSYRTITERPISGITYQMRANLKTKAFLKILAHLGIYLWATGRSSAGQYFDTIDDDTYIGYMNADGTTTGELLRGEDITKSDTKNKDYNTSNSDFNPDKQPDDFLASQPPNPYSLRESFLHRYLLTSQEMIDLKIALDGETLQELNAIQYVVDLQIIPDFFDDYLITHSASSIKFGKTDVQLPASEIDYSISIIKLGSVSLTRKYNNFLDYEPYTKVKLYVPFCGTCNLPTDKILDNTINVWLFYDYITGNCTCGIYVGESLITTMTGNVYCPVPLTQDISVQKTNLQQVAMLSTAGGVITSAATGAALGSVPVAIGGAMMSALSYEKNMLDIKQKADTEVAGGSGNISMFNMPMECCLYYERPDVDIPDNFGSINGFACNKGGRLGDFKGFTSCSEFHLDKILCTKTEKEMIEDLLKKGVILDE